MSGIAFDRGHQERRRRAIRGRIFRRGKLSVRVQPRTLWVAAGLCAAVLILAIVSISAGDYPLPVRDVIMALLGQGSGSSSFIVLGLRLPRALTAILVGMAFGMSGAIFQSLARNPLASPDIIGFNSGAALGAVSMIILFHASGIMVALGALSGGLITAALVFALAWQNGFSPIRVVLVGIGISFAAYAGVDFLMTRSDIFEATAATIWLTGSLNARVWEHVYITGAGLAVLLPLALFLQSALDQLELGEDTAAALGIRVNFTRLFIAIIATLLAAIAVAAAGPLAFVAFVAGPIARRLADTSGAALLLAALVGALVVLAGDLAGRLVFAPTQLPAGIFTAIFGAPFLLWLLATQIRKGAL